MKECKYRIEEIESKIKDGLIKINLNIEDGKDPKHTYICLGKHTYIRLGVLKQILEDFLK